MALNAAKQRAADAGIDLNFAKLMTQEMPPDEENFAACLEAIETIGHFPDLLPEFNGLTPHFEQQSAAPRYRNFGYAVSADYSFNFDPRKSSHEVGCREILRLLNGWDAEFARISEASKRKHYVIKKIGLALLMRSALLQTTTLQRRFICAQWHGWELVTIKAQFQIWKQCFG